MKTKNYFFLGLSIIGFLWAFAQPVAADDVQRHRTSKIHSQKQSGHHRYYRKAPKVIHRSLSYKHKYKHKQKHKHYSRHYREDLRHHGKVHKKQRHSHRHNNEAFLIGLGLGLIINH